MKIAYKVKVINEKENIIYNGIMFFNGLFGFKGFFGVRVSKEEMKNLIKLKEK